MKQIKITLLKIESTIKSFIFKWIKNKGLQRIIDTGAYNQIPIYIISYNRLDYLTQTIDWLEKRGYTNINIVDNNSTYEPLLKYLEGIKYKKYMMKKNWGHTVFFKAPSFFFKRNFHFFILTDPDLSPLTECPNDFVEQFCKIMKCHPEYTKVGFSLKLDDIPDDYYLKEEVLTWESKFYEKKISSDCQYDCYDANIDTTFALNEPRIFTAYMNIYKGIRTGVPYQVRHLPWYVNHNSEQELYYLKSLRRDVSNWNGNVSKEQMQKRIKKHNL